MAKPLFPVVKAFALANQSHAKKKATGSSNEPSPQQRTLGLAKISHFWPFCNAPSREGVRYV